MVRILLFAGLLPLIALAGCDVPGPAQYDHAMLRAYFGKSPGQIEAAFGEPEVTACTDSQLPPQDATSEEKAMFNQHTRSMSYEYATPDGELVFHFNLNDEVYAITYAGQDVSQASR